MRATPSTCRETVALPPPRKAGAVPASDAAATTQSPASKRVALAPQAQTLGPARAMGAPPPPGVDRAAELEVRRKAASPNGVSPNS